MRLPSTRDARTRPDARVPKDGGRVSTGRGGEPTFATGRRTGDPWRRSNPATGARRPGGHQAGRRFRSGGREHASPARVLVLHGSERAASARSRMWSSDSSSRSGMRARRRGRKGGYGRHVARGVTVPVNWESTGLNRCPVARPWPSIVERRGMRIAGPCGEVGDARPSASRVTEGHRGAVPRSRRRTSTGPGRQWKGAWCASASR